MARPLVRARIGPPMTSAISLGVSRQYSQIRSPLVALSASTPALGLTTYITPCATIGVVSWVPAVSPRVHAILSPLTLPRLTWSSGLKRCSS